MPALTRHSVGGVTLLGDLEVPHGVTLAFTERTGGVSQGEYASLNLGSRCGDDPACVDENRRRVLCAMGAGELAGRTVCPRQVHGDRVVVVRGGEGPALAAARQEAEAGADAVCCVAREVPVLLCFADCVPVVLVAPGGFVVAHSGWRGTLARISAKAVGVLCEETGCKPGQVLAYVGPHIGGADYEVSEELLERFEGEFGPLARASERHLDLGACVRAALEDAGVPAGSVVEAGVSTASATDRFFSHRAEGGRTGRHAAVAVMLEEEAQSMQGSDL